MLAWVRARVPARDACLVRVVGELAEPVRELVRRGHGEAVRVQRWHLRTRTRFGEGMAGVVGEAHQEVPVVIVQG